LAAASLGSPEKLPTFPPTSIPNPFGSLITIWNSNGELYRELRRPEPFFLLDDTLPSLAEGRNLLSLRRRHRMISLFQYLKLKPASLFATSRARTPGAHAT